jgi:hypothetical protein
MRWKKDWTMLVLLFLVLRTVYSLLGARTGSGPAPEPLATGPIYDAVNTLLHGGRFSELFVNVWMRWDTGWLLKIAAFGYAPADGTVSFQPLYPFLVGLLGRLGGDYLLAALLLSNLAGLAALILFYEVARAEGLDSPAALAAALWLAMFPTAFFLFSAYSDPLFLALALGAWRAARQKQWLAAGLLGGLATLCRLQGALLAPVLAWAWLASLAGETATPGAQLGFVWRLVTRRTGWQRIAQALRRPAWIGFLLPAAALLGWTLALRLSGLGSIPETLETHWGIRTVMPWSGVWLFLQRLFTTPRVFVDYIDLSTLVLVLALLVAGLRKLDPALSLYAWLTLALFFMRGTPPHLLDSFSRYMLSVFPAFLVLGRVRSRYLRIPLWALSFSLQIFLVMGFLDWRWVA